MAAKTKEKPAAPETARAPEITSRNAGTIQVVVFALGNEQFAIDLFDVREVVEYTTITKLPNVPAYIRGIMDLRGEITTIVDLRHRLGLPENDEISRETSRIIVLDSNVTRVKTGILVDDVTSVSTFEASQVDYTSASVSNEDTGIIGIIKTKVKVMDKEKSELTIWIDVRKLLDDAETA